MDTNRNIYSNNFLFITSNVIKAVNNGVTYYMFLILCTPAPYESLWIWISKVFTALLLFHLLICCSLLTNCVWIIPFLKILNTNTSLWQCGKKFLRFLQFIKNRKVGIHSFYLILCWDVCAQPFYDLSRNVQSDSSLDSGLATRGHSQSDSEAFEILTMSFGSLPCWKIKVRYSGAGCITAYIFPVSWLV